MKIFLESKEIHIGDYREFRIDDVIKQLQEIKKEHGNLVVASEEIIGDEPYGYSIANIKVVRMDVKVDGKFEDKVVWIEGL